MNEEINCQDRRFNEKIISNTPSVKDNSDIKPSSINQNHNPIQHQNSMQRDRPLTHKETVVALKNKDGGVE